MGTDSTNSGIPVFGELINLLDKHEISKIADKLKSDRYTKRLDSYQHLVIMLYATLGQFNSLREVELGFLSSATRMNHFCLDYMVRRSTLSDANRSGSVLLQSDEEISGPAFRFWQNEEEIPTPAFEFPSNEEEISPSGLVKPLSDEENPLPAFRRLQSDEIIGVPYLQNY